MTSSVRRPSAALIVAVIALVAALAGGAAALPGTGTVDRNDLKRNAVTKRAIKRKAVTKRALKTAAVTAQKLAPEAVTGAAIAAGAVTPEKIAEHEPRHVVGSPGEPQFSNGGEGDCIWQDGSALGGFGRVSYYKDELGYVRLNGLAIAADGPGGDGVCDLNDAGEAEDGVVFALPAQYLPSEVVFTFGVNGPTAVTPSAGAILGQLVPGGVVYADEGAFLTGITYEPASAAASAHSKRRPPVDLRPLMRAVR